MKTAILIKIDIKGFHQSTANQDPAATAAYLRGFYELAAEQVKVYEWRLVKTIGDSLLIAAEQNNSPSKIEKLHQAVSNFFPVNTCYRICSYEEVLWESPDYRCNDLFGRDVNLLFLGDEETIELG